MTFVLTRASPEELEWGKKISLSFSLFQAGRDALLHPASCHYLKETPYPNTSINVLPTFLALLIASFFLGAYHQDWSLPPTPQDQPRSADTATTICHDSVAR